ncbi:MAG: SLBB domain-containing protein [candidate division WOR-3 bacterium]|nr:SLBB domain-containing protein [candidate division WOR-3 bacterium]
MRNISQAILIIIIFYSLSFAQVTQETGGLQGIETPINPEEYVVMPGDNLLVTIMGKNTYSYNTFVTYEGKMTINIPMAQITEAGLSKPYHEIIDAVGVSGLTLKQAQDSINIVFARYFKETKIKLTLTGIHTCIVFVTGEVEKPGAYNAFPTERISQVINRAGGVTPVGSKAKIRLLRNGQFYTEVNLEQFEINGDLTANPFIESGDIIFVPAVSAMVSVKGAVFGRGGSKLRTSALTTEKERISEGVYELTPGERVLDLINKAGGVTPWADLNATYIERLAFGSSERKKIPVDLNKILLENDQSANLEMMNADILVIPPINTLVYVEGEVDAPGSFFFTPNQRVSHYIGQAGGPTNYANLRRAYLKRENQKISILPDPITEPGDIIYVPRVSFKWWQDYVQVLSSIAIPLAVTVISVMLAAQQ